MSLFSLFPVGLKFYHNRVFVFLYCYMEWFLPYGKYLITITWMESLISKSMFIFLKSTSIFSWVCCWIIHTQPSISTWLPWQLQLNLPSLQGRRRNTNFRTQSRTVFKLSFWDSLGLGGIASISLMAIYLIIKAMRKLPEFPTIET